MTEGAKSCTYFPHQVVFEEIERMFLASDNAKVTADGNEAVVVAHNGWIKKDKPRKHLIMFIIPLELKREILPENIQDEISSAALFLSAELIVVQSQPQPEHHIIYIHTQLNGPHWAFAISDCNAISTFGPIQDLKLLRAAVFAVTGIQFKL